MKVTLPAKPVDRFEIEFYQNGSRSVHHCKLQYHVNTYFPVAQCVKRVECSHPGLPRLQEEVLKSPLRISDS